MKKHLILFMGVLMTVTAVRAQVAINTDGSTPNSSAMLDVKSDTAGILIPRMTATQRDAISSPVQGLLVYVTDDNTFYFYTGSSWEKVGRGASGWIVYRNYVYVLSDSVGIGTGNITAPLVVKGRIAQTGTGQSVFLGEGAGANSQLSLYRHNVFIGYEAGNANIDGGSNTAVGHRALKNSTEADDNTAFGYEALTNNTTGEYNVAVGEAALDLNSTGNFNTALGSEALIMNTTGHSNVAVGVRALYNNSNRNNIVAVGDSALFNNGVGANHPYHSITNTAIGSKAMFSNTTGYDNTGVGFNVMYYNTTGYENSAFGQSALRKNTTGHYNTAIGFRTLFNNVTGNLNSALGYKALFSNTTGYSNIAIGSGALYNNTDRHNIVAIGDSALFNNGVGASEAYHSLTNTALGSKAMFSNTTGYDNTGVGFHVMYYNTTGHYNTAIGFRSLFNNVTGSSNSALGYKALFSNTSGSANVANGYYALYSNTTGYSNVAIGPGALYNNTDRHNIVAIGDSALYNNCVGASAPYHSITNTAIGSKALYSNNTGYDNTGVGFNVMYANTTGYENSAFGQSALRKNTTGQYNTAIGFRTLYEVVSGSNNTALGYRAGSSTTGSGNVFIGYKAGHNETGSNKLYIDNSETSNPLIGGDFSTDEVDVNGVLKVSTGSAANTPQAGMIRWNSTTQDFEGYDGTKWISFTGIKSWGYNTLLTEDQNATSSDGADDDYFGNSVSIDGNYAIVGANNKTILGNSHQGKAYIFHYDGGSWVQQGQLTASDGAAGDYFGHSVSIRGDYAIVGAFNKSVSGNSCQGKAYIFHYDGSAWSEQAGLTASDGTSDDYFGCSVSIDGDYAIVGAYGKNVSSNLYQGKAYIFHYDGSSWTEQQGLTSSDGGSVDHFGNSVSIDGNYVIVGADTKVIGDSLYQGKTYIFHNNGSTWSEQAILTASDGVAYDHFGCSVSIDGDYAVVGAYGKNSCQGKAYIFHYDGSSWTEQAGLVPSDIATWDYFGNSVSINGDYAIVGAHFKDVSGNYHQGKAYVFKCNSNACWIEQVGLISSDGAADDNFGSSVSINNNYIIIGADLKDVGSKYDQGEVYFYKKNN